MGGNSQACWWIGIIKQRSGFFLKRCRLACVVVSQIRLAQAFCDLVVGADIPRVARSSVQQGNRTNIKEGMSFRLFGAWNSFRAARCQYRRRRCYITALRCVSLCFSLCLTLLFSIFLILLLSAHSHSLRLFLYRKLRWDKCALLQIHAEQSNYCDNISAWLINCSLCASERSCIWSIYS